jgi:hypothetical protein
MNKIPFPPVRNIAKRTDSQKTYPHSARPLETTPATNRKEKENWMGIDLWSFHFPATLNDLSDMKYNEEVFRKQAAMMDTISTASRRANERHSSFRSI